MGRAVFTGTAADGRFLPGFSPRSEHDAQLQDILSSAFRRTDALNVRTPAQDKQKTNNNQPDLFGDVLL